MHQTKEKCFLVQFWGFMSLTAELGQRVGQYNNLVHIYEDYKLCIYKKKQGHLNLWNALNPKCLGSWNFSIIFVSFKHEVHK